MLQRCQFFCYRINNAALKKPVGFFHQGQIAIPFIPPHERSGNNNAGASEIKIAPVILGYLMTAMEFVVIIKAVNFKGPVPQMLKEIYCFIGKVVWLEDDHIKAPVKIVYHPLHGGHLR